MTVFSLVAAMLITALYIYLAPVTRLAGALLALSLTALAAAAISSERLKRRRLIAELSEILSGKPDPISEGEHSPILRLALDLRLGCEAREARLRDGYARLASLVSDIAHQTKTPLAVLKLQSEQAVINTLDTSPQAYPTEQLERLEFLIDALTKLSKCESGLISGSLKLRTASLIELLAEAVGAVLPAADARGISFEVDCADKVTAVFDPRWTAEARFNLLDNAVKYSPEGSVVRISVALLEGFVRIDISDEGEGITEAELNRIWERFYRGENARNKPGVGIGLYLTREIVSSQGGRVRAEVGSGGRFSVYLVR